MNEYERSKLADAIVKEFSENITSKVMGGMAATELWFSIVRELNNAYKDGIEEGRKEMYDGAMNYMADTI